MNKKKVKKVLKDKKIIIFSVILIILIVCIILLKGTFFPSGGSKYGNRLDGIEKINFNEKEKDRINEFITSNEKVTSSKINIHGKIINIIYNVNKDVNIDDAKSIAISSLEEIPNKVKKFYDIQFIVTKTEEIGEEVESKDENGKTITTTVKNFPIMGYKNSSNDNIVW